MNPRTCYLGYKDTILTLVVFTMMGYKSVCMNMHIIFQLLEPIIEFSGVAHEHTSTLMGKSIGTINQFLEVGAFIIFTPTKKKRSYAPHP